jgi:hypothetical protein
MRAVGATARHQIGAAIEQKCGAFVLDRRGQRFDTIDQGTFVGFGQPQQYRSNVTGIQSRSQLVRK